MRYRFAKRLSRVFVRFYPKEFQRAYAAEMEHVFLEAVANDGRVGKRWATARGCLALLRDTVTRAPVEHASAVYRTLTQGGRDSGGQWQPMQNIVRDVRHATRGLLKRPGFTIVAVLTLALGIGANTAIFSVVNGVLLRPLPYFDADRLIVLWESAESAGLPHVPLAQSDFATFRERSNSFSHLSASGGGLGRVLTGVGEPELLNSVAVSPSLFSMLGARALHGRLLEEADEAPGAGAVVVLGHDFWANRFGSDPSVIGTTLSLSDEPYEVVGVMDPSFQYPPPITMGDQLLSTSNVNDIWLPMTMDPANLDRTQHGLFVLGRLAPGVTLEQASDDVATVSRQITDELGGHPGVSSYVLNLHAQGVTRLRPALFIMLGAVSFVLLIACANLANLLLARASARRREFAVRAAIGASRGRLVSQLLTESVLLAGVGGLLGIGVARAAAGLVIRANPIDLPRMFDATLDAKVLLFLAVVSAGTALLFGLAPALQVSRVELRAAMQSGRTTSGRSELRAKNALIVGQVAVAMLLLVGAGLLVRSFVNLQRLDPGVESTGVLTVGVLLPESRYQSDESETEFADRVTTRLRAVPGVRRVGATQSLPFTQGRSGSNFTVEGEPPREAGQFEIAERRQITEEYLSAMGIPLRDGRGFELGDSPGALPVAIVNQTLAERHWPGESPVGRRLTFDTPTDDDAVWLTVVGVAGDVRQLGLMSPVEPTVYLPLRQEPTRGLWLAVRGSGDPMTMLPAIRSAIWELDPDLATVDPQPMEDRVRSSVNQPRFITTIFLLFGGAGLVLAAIGVYGVISFAVSQQTRDIGVRIAFGAAPGAVLRMVLHRALALVGGGVVIGLAGAFFASRLLASLLFGVGSTDFVTFGAVTLLLAGIAALATLLPARRATKIDPVAALRAE